MMVVENTFTTWFHNVFLKTHCHDCFLSVVLTVAFAVKNTRKCLSSVRTGWQTRRNRKRSNSCILQVTNSFEYLSNWPRIVCLAGKGCYRETRTHMETQFLLKHGNEINAALSLTYRHDAVGILGGDILSEPQKVVVTPPDHVLFVRIIHSVCLKNNDRCVGSNDDILRAVAYSKGGGGWAPPRVIQKPTTLLQAARLGSNNITFFRVFGPPWCSNLNTLPPNEYTRIRLLAFVVTLYVMYVSSGSTIFCGLSTVTWVSRRNTNFGRKSSSSAAAAAAVAFAGNDTSWKKKTALFLETRTCVRASESCALTAGVSLDGGATFFFSCTDTSSTAVLLRSAIIVPSRSAGGWKNASIRPVTVPRRRASGRRRSAAISVPNNPAAGTFSAVQETIGVISDRRCLHARSRTRPWRPSRYRRYHHRYDNAAAAMPRNGAPIESIVFEVPPRQTAEICTGNEGRIVFLRAQTGSRRENRVRHRYVAIERY